MPDTVDAAFIAISRRHRRAKTDGIDGETLVRALMAWIRGQPRVCSMLRVPSIEEEDRRPIGRDRTALVKELTLHTNRIKCLLFSVGARGYEPNRRDRRTCLEELRTGSGQPLPVHLKAMFVRELDRLEVTLSHVAEILDQDEEWLFEVAEEMETEYGRL